MKKLKSSRVLSIILALVMVFSLSLSAVAANEDYTPSVEGVVSADRSTLTISAVFPDTSTYTVTPVNAYVGFLITFKDGCVGTLNYEDDCFAQFYVLQSDGSFGENNVNGSGNAGIVCMYASMPSITFTLQGAPVSGAVAEISPAKAGYGASSGTGTPPSEDYYAYILTGKLGTGKLDSYWTTATVNGDGSLPASPPPATATLLMLASL